MVNLKEKVAVALSNIDLQELIRLKTLAKKQSGSFMIMSAPEFAVPFLPFCLHVCSSSHCSSIPGTKHLT